MKLLGISFCLVFWNFIVINPGVAAVVRSLSHVWLFATQWTAARQASLSFTISWSLLKLISIESVMPSSYLALCFPLLLRPSISPSITIFSNELSLHIRWWNYWSFSFSISPSSEYSGLISFRIDWPAPPQLEVLPVAVLQCFIMAWHRCLCPRDHHDLLWQKLVYLYMGHQNWVGVYQKTSKNLLWVPTISLSDHTV